MTQGPAIPVPGTTAHVTRRAGAIWCEAEALLYAALLRADSANAATDYPGPIDQEDGMTEMRPGMGHMKRMACRFAIAVMTAVGVYAMASAPAAAGEPPAKGKSPIIDRIRDSGTMRVGINVALPWLGQNPQTREFFG